MKYYRLTLAALAVVAMAGCSGREQTAEQAEELPLVTVDVAYRRPVPLAKTYTASVEADNVNNIAPATPNRIKTIAVEVGDHVRRGQTLVTLDSSAADQLRISMDNLQREYDRANQLLHIGSGTQQSVDQLEAQLLAARSQYANMLENTILTSPIDGVVTARNLDPGDMTGTVPVLVVGQLRPVVKVMLAVSENDISRVQRGMPVQVSFDAYPGRTFEGSVNRIYPTVDPSTRTFEVEVQIANPAEDIKPGMFARVDINMGQRDNVVVPDRAIVKQTGSGNRYVYVLSGGRVSYRQVQLGQRLDDSYELLDGISDGDTVVISGQTRLADGVEVEVRP